ncbi:hypothetical protein HZS55_02955 [Halosimplex rubrum]|uniref:Uncharacterized protein n=2 Tax=Halosimplex rubrum TaxID=869889 RepID=A0A7D5P2B3_9EURY|nr:hypothetical protein HZS55_02955 [Halosimplex rubrum]
MESSGRSDLSEHDEQGLQKYEEAYNLSEDALAEYNTGRQLFFENLPEGESNLEDYPFDWQTLSDTMESASEYFGEAADLFEESRQLSESPEFNEPCVRAVDWTQAHLDALSMFGDLGGPSRDWFTQRHNEAKRADSPLPPAQLLDRILGRPTESYTPLDEGTPMETPSSAETETSEETPTSDLQIVSRGFSVDDSSDEPAPYVAATIVNRGDGQSGPAELVVRWYDDDGNFLYEGGGQAELVSLAVEETWEARVYASKEQASIGDAEIEIDAEGYPIPSDENVEVQNSELQTNGTTVTITGELANTSGQELLSASAYSKIYDGDGVVLAGGHDQETDIPAEETWQFEIQWDARDRIDRVSEHVAVGYGNT